jgi:hypothetical protein
MGGDGGFGKRSFNRWALDEQQLLFDARNNRPDHAVEGVGMDEGADSTMGDEWHSHWWGCPTTL